MGRSADTNVTLNKTSNNWSTAVLVRMCYLRVYGSVFRRGRVLGLELPPITTTSWSIYRAEMERPGHSSRLGKVPDGIGPVRTGRSGLPGGPELTGSTRQRGGGCWDPPDCHRSPHEARGTDSPLDPLPTPATIVNPGPQPPNKTPPALWLPCDHSDF